MQKGVRTKEEEEVEREEKAERRRGGNLERGRDRKSVV